MAKIENRYFTDNDNLYLEVINTRGHKIYFIIDEDDRTEAEKHRWYAMYCPQRKSHFLEDRYGMKYHRLIMKTPDDLVVDHINRCTYDNRKINLRNCTVAENSRNIRRPKYQTHPKKSKLGISYISVKDCFGRTYYDVRYKNYQRKYFRNLDDAKNYLEDIKRKEKYGC